MTKRRRIIMMLATALLALAAGAALFRSREPRYQGRSLSHYVDQRHQTWSKGQVDPEAEEALRRIGTNAIPLLLNWICHEPGVWSDVRDRLSGLLGLLPERFRPDWLVRDRAAERADAALYAFSLLGPEAKSAIPTLTRLANDTNHPATAALAIAAMGYLGTDAFPQLLTLLSNDSPSRYFSAALAMSGQGTNATPAIPLLLKYYKQDRHPAFATALGDLAIEPSLVVPALVEGLRDPRYEDRYYAARALGKFGERARSAVPALIEALKDPDRTICDSATNSLLKIAPEVLTNAPPK